MNITKKHITKKSRNSKLKEKYYINEKTDLATRKDFVLQHSLKINKRGSPNKLRRDRKKIEKLISVPPFIRHLRTMCLLHAKDNKVVVRAFLTTYCVRYPHAVSFLRNEMPYSLLKTPKTHAV